MSKSTCFDIDPSLLRICNIDSIILLQSLEDSGLPRLLPSLQGKSKIPISVPPIVVTNNHNNGR